MQETGYLDTVRRRKSDRRALLKLAALGGGIAALGRATTRAEAASGGTFLLGRPNDAEKDSTTLNSGAADTLVIKNRSTSATGIKVERTGTGVRAEGAVEGVRGVGSTGVGGYADKPAGIGVAGSADGAPLIGRGVYGRSGARSGSEPGNVGVHGFADSGVGVMGEGGGGTGVRGYSHQWSTGSAPLGVGVQGVGTVAGVLAQGFTGGVALRAQAPSGGTAIDAAGLVKVAGHIDATGTITGQGGEIGILAKSGNRGVALKAIAPSEGTAIEALGPVTVDGPLDAGSLSGDGSDVTNLDATNVSTGRLDVLRLPLQVARRDGFNVFTRINDFQSTTRFRGRVIAAAAAVVTVPAGRDRVEVTLATGVTVGTASVILLTPLGSTDGALYHAERVSSSSFRIVLSGPAPADLRFSYAVFN